MTDSNDPDPWEDRRKPLLSVAVEAESIATATIMATPNAGTRTCSIDDLSAALDRRAIHFRQSKVRVVRMRQPMRNSRHAILVLAILCALTCRALWPIQSGASEHYEVLTMHKSVPLKQYWLQSVAWSPDGKYLAVTGGAPKTQIWNVDNLTLERTLSGGARGMDGSSRHAVVYSDDGQLLVSGFFTGTVWATSDWRPVATLIGPAATVGYPSPFGVMSLAITASRRKVIIAYLRLRQPSPIVAYGTDTGTIAWSRTWTPAIGGHPYPTTGLYRVGSSDLVVIGTYENTVYTEKAGPPGQRLSCIVFLNANTGKVARTIDHAQSDRITAMTVSREGSLIATGTNTGEVSSWYNVTTRKSTTFRNLDPVRIWNAITGKLMEQLQVKNEVWALAFSSDNKYLFDAESQSPNQMVLNLWDLRTGTLAQSLFAPTNDSDVFALAMSPDGSHLAAVGTGIAVYDYHDSRD